MDESNKELKELESVHEKHKKTQEVCLKSGWVMRSCLWLTSLKSFCFLFRCNDQGLDNELRECKEKFKEFERQDVKHREDLKHVKQKIKKLEDKLQKVGYKRIYLFMWAYIP